MSSRRRVYTEFSLQIDFACQNRLGRILRYKSEKQKTDKLVQIKVRRHEILIRQSEVGPSCDVMSIEA